MQTRAPRSSFVFDQLNPSSQADIVEAVDDTIEESVNRITNDVSPDRLRELLANPTQSDWLRGRNVTGDADPEPITRQRIVEPLLDVLGFGDRLREVKGEGEEGRATALKADYSISLDGIDTDSKRLVIEAEPIGKGLDHSDHGLGQVREWLGRRRFLADYGIATDGIRWILVKYNPDTDGTDVLVSVDLTPAFLHHLDGEQAQLGDAHAERVDEFVAAFERYNLFEVIREAPAVLAAQRKELTDEFYDEYVSAVFGDLDDPSSTSLISDGVLPPDDATVEHQQLFAVTLTNRLIFVEFLEDKWLVQPGLLNDIIEEYRDGYYPNTSLYKQFVQPLFFDVLATRPSKREPHAEHELFEGIPYLNSDLFRSEIEGSGQQPIDERPFDVRDDELIEIIELLEDYTFSADGSPHDLDPSIIGNVFEKTINKITLSSQSQKELGAYYTPDSITRFCSERTVPPALLERFQDIFGDEEGDYYYLMDWEYDDIDAYDDVYEFIADLPELEGVEDDLLAAVNDFRAIDPACGSGHFLTSVINDIVRIRHAIHERKPDPTPEPFTLAKRTVLNNIYGVDIMPQAIQIGKLRLWLSVLEKGETATLQRKVEQEDEDWLTLPNIGFNLRSGNSLIGYIGLEEEGQTTIGSWNQQSVRRRYAAVIRKVREYKRTDDDKAALEARHEAEDKIRDHAEGLNERVREDFAEAGVEDITADEIAEYDPMHWVVEFAEVYAEGGFDIIVANPPWDRLTADRDTFFARFDDRYDVGFRVLPPSEADARVDELLEDDDIEESWEEFRRQMDQRSTYFSNSDTYDLQDPEVFDRKVGAEDDLSRLFLERAFELARDDSHTAFVLPGNLWLGASAKDLRHHLLDNTEFHTLAQFINGDIFDNVDNRKRICIIAFGNSGEIDTVHGAFEHGDTTILNDFDETATTVERDLLERFSPESFVFPYIRSRDQIDILETIIDHPMISDDTEDWYLNPYRELDRTNDRDRFVENEADGDYPVYGGRNIYQYSYDDAHIDIQKPEFWSVDDGSDDDAKQRIREKKQRDLKNAIYHDLNLKGLSMKGAVNDLLEKRRSRELTPDDVLLDCNAPRIVYRDVARPTDERTMIGAVIPSGIVCHNKLHTVSRFEPKPAGRDELEEFPLHNIYHRTLTDEEMFAALGLLNSLPVGYLMRSKIDSTVVMYKVKESQMPHLTEGDDCFDYIWQRAARLSFYGPQFEDLREKLDLTPANTKAERDRLRAEIDAAALTVYGLSDHEAEYLIEDFYRTDDPTLMTDDYFDLVLEKYREIKN